MTPFHGRAVAAACLVASLGGWMTPATAQTDGAKEKPPLYTYVSNWVIPRARWGDMEKAGAADQKILDHAVETGGILGYGSDTTLIHQIDGSTHSDWWVANSEAGLLNALDEIYKAGLATTAVLGSATRHWDDMYVSRSYGWHPGSVRGAYVHGASYRLKADAPNDAVETLSKALFTPFFEKLMADGTVLAYQVAEEAIHTQDPGTFFIFYITGKAEGMDKVNAALREAVRTNALAAPAFGSMVDFVPHRDELGRVVNATLK